MKVFFLCSMILLFTNTVFAKKENLRIEHFDIPSSSEEAPHLYFSDGKVGVLKDPSFLRNDFQVGIWVNVDMDAKHIIRSIELTSDRRNYFEDEIPFQVSSKEYTPTVLPSAASVDKIFRKMKRGWQKESQCFNRAHIWNYEEFKRSGLLSKKVFIFFTSRYIRKYKFKWWFHAIPTVLVRDKGKVVERALDPRYVKKPLPIKTWSDVFVKSKRACPVITKYSTYRDNQMTEDCYLHYASMYYYVPSDLARYEEDGTERNSFIQPEIEWAYYEAF